MGEDPSRIREQIAETREHLSENVEADEIRTEIQETREQMSETVEALGHKADVKTRVKDSITDKKDAVLCPREPTSSRERQSSGKGRKRSASRRRTRLASQSEEPPSASSPASSSPRPASRTRTSARSLIRSSTGSKKPGRTPSSEASRSHRKPWQAPKKLQS
jgi:Protein of unknown function (DUF3618)